MTRLLTLTVVTVSFFVCLQITTLLVVPVQDWFSLDPSYAALLFLPHGIRVVSVYILGPLSGFLHIMFAVFLIELILDISYLSNATIRDYLSMLVGAASAPLAPVAPRCLGCCSLAQASSVWAAQHRSLAAPSPSSGLLQ